MLNKFDIKFLENNIPFYNKLSQSEKELFDSKSIHVKYSNLSPIYISDENCNGLIIVISGILRAFLNSMEGKEITLYRLFQGDTCILSASCIFKNIDFNINLHSLEDTEVIIFPSRYLDQISKSNQYLQQYLLELTQSRFSEVMWVMQDIVFTSFDRRLINYLEEFHSSTIKITHDSIAKDLGTAREVVSRMLKYFEKEGMVKLSRGAIEIIDLNFKKE